MAAKRKGFEVMVFEKDLSAVRGEGQYKGLIQIQSNALDALEAIDSDVADEVMRVSCITGDRIKFPVDRVSSSWSKSSAIEVNKCLNSESCYQNLADLTATIQKELSQSKFSYCWVCASGRCL
ncbi:hypothetical protein RYX36_032446 [Vicia faba]